MNQDSHQATGNHCGKKKGQKWGLTDKVQFIGIVDSEWQVSEMRHYISQAPGFINSVANDIIFRAAYQEESIF